MLLNRLFRSTKARRVDARRLGATARLSLEALEDRCLLSFSPAIYYSAEAETSAVVAADFDSDGRPDIATARLYRASVGVFLNQGGGTFGPRTDYSTDFHPHHVAAGDFNDDGRADLLTASSESSLYGNVASLSVLLGRGDGTFADPIILPSGAPLSSYFDMKVSDFDANGYDDVAGLSAAAPGVFVWMNNGEGGFDPPVSYLNLTSPIETADVTSDSVTDIIVAGENTILVLPGLGDGTFGAPIESWYYYPYGDGVESLRAGDFNNDKRLDLAVSRGLCGGGEEGSGCNYAVDILPGAGDGTFGSSMWTESGWSFPLLPLADFDADGNLDLAVSRGGYEPIVYSGNGDGTLTLVPLSGDFPPWTGYGDVVADFSGDGFPDLADRLVQVSLMQPTGRDGRQSRLAT